MLPTVDGILLILYKLCLLIWLSPGCWTVVVSFYVERRKIISLRKWNIANVGKKKNLPVVRSLWAHLRQLTSLPEFFSGGNCRECRNIPFKNLCLRCRKGSQAAVLSWCGFTFEELNINKFSPYPVPPASPSTWKVSFILIQSLYWVNRENVFSSCCQIRSQHMAEFTPTS